MTKIAFIFPGQGSHSVGMLKDIAEVHPTIKKPFTQASAVLGYDLWEMTQQGPAEQLDQTVYTQPALLTASYALWTLISAEEKRTPKFLAGHSLGEYTALVCAKALDFVDAVRLVAARGLYMQEATPAGVGALAAIVGLSDEEVQALCDQVRSPSEVLSPANFNSPGQVVVAGHTTAIDRLILAAKDAGARLAKKLAVSVPSHCELMKPAALRLDQLLKDISIQTPVISVLSNVDVKPYESADAIRDGLSRQLYSPVRWVETVHAFATAGVSELIECGPGKVLSGLNKRIVPDMQVMNTADLNSLQAAL